MAWNEVPDEAFAKTRGEAVCYVSSQLHDAVPQGWSICAMGDDAAAWNIVKTNLQPGEWPNKDYGLRLTRGLDFLIFTHGNKDVGGWNLDKALLQSLVISPATVRHFGMRALLEHLMLHYKPNEWGYT